MAITDNYVPLNQQGNGVTVDFSGNWPMLSEDYFLGSKELISTGVRTPLVIGGDGALAFDNSGFTFSFNVAPSALYNVIIARDVALDQTNPYKTSKGFQGAVLENSFDKVTAITQDLRDQVNRAPKFVLGSTDTATLDVLVDGGILYVDGSTIKSDLASMDDIADISASVATCVAAAVSCAADAISAAASAAAALGAVGGVKVTTADTTPSVLNNKIVMTSTMLVKVTNSPAGNETLGLDINLASNPGLENSSGLRVKTTANKGIQRTSGGMELDINNIATISIDTAADYVPFYDASGAVIGKCLASAIGSKPQLHQTIITASSNFTTSANITTATVHRIILLGAGAGGKPASTTGTVGGGGGAGAELELIVSGLSPSTTYAVVIGAGGASDTAGGNSTFVIGATTYTAPGGSVGTVGAGIASPGLGGLGGLIPTNGTRNTPGESGFVGVASSGALGYSGQGASTRFGKGGRPVVVDSSVGTVGNGYGSGGSGGFAVNGTGARAGGAGMNGLFIVEWEE